MYATTNIETTLTGDFAQKKKNYGTGTRTQDLWTTVPALSYLI